MPVGWGVMGAGGIADRRTIPEGIVPATNARLVAVMDVDEKRAREVSGKYGGVPWYKEEDALLSNSEVEAVYVATPTYLHCEHTLRALLAGKHVLCEKPMAMNLAECEKMIEAADDRGLKLAVGYMMRFHSWHQELKSMVEAGHLGTLVMGRAQLTCWYPPISGAWRQVPEQGGGGALVDMGSHCIDVLEMYLGRTVEVVAFTGTIVQNYPVEDTAVALIRFSSGATGFVDAHFNVPDEASVNMLELYGSKGRVNGRGTIGQSSTGEMTACLQAEGKGYEAAQKRSGTEEIEITPSEVVNIYQAQIEDFSDAILNDRVPAVPGEDGLWNLRVVLAAYESARTGRAVRLSG